MNKMADGLDKLDFIPDFLHSELRDANIPTGVLSNLAFWFRLDTRCKRLPTL